MKSDEVKKRYVDRSESSSWIWPDQKLSYREVHKMMAIMLEIAVNIFFRSFVYTFGGKCYLQSTGGPIGARLTMCVARLVLQDWFEEFSEILDKSDIIQHLKGLYVDDGRNIVDQLVLGTRFVKEAKLFLHKDCWEAEDILHNVDRRILTEREIRECMNSINPDLTFTTENENDFANKRLPTLSFQLWSEVEGLRYSYFEKSMRSQILTMAKSSQSER